MLKKRGCGILLHPTSLPGPDAIGTLGADARRFVDLLRSMGMSYWQVLPLAPPACGNSPYSAFTAFGGNPLLIDLEQLVEAGDLPRPLCHPAYPKNRVDFGLVYQTKPELLCQAGSHFLQHGSDRRKSCFDAFCAAAPWLHNFALFMALKRRYNGVSWHHWSSDAACPTLEMVQTLSQELEQEITIQKYLQWQFTQQWHELRRYANQQGIAVIGDIPIFVAYDSADVWSQRELFLLDESGKPTVVAGVPPTISVPPDSYGAIRTTTGI